MVYSLGGRGMGDSELRLAGKFAPAARVNKQHSQNQDRQVEVFPFAHDDDLLLESEFHSDGVFEGVDGGGYASDHDEMLHEGFGRETEDEVDGMDGGGALSEEGYGSHREDSFGRGASSPAKMLAARHSVQSDREVDLHPLNNQVGGHTRLLVLNDSTVIKPLNARELHFYQNIPREIEMFVPKYKGKNCLSDQEQIMTRNRQQKLSVQFCHNVNPC